MPAPSTPAPAPAAAIHKIQHVIVIMQENRDFDEDFGTYPGADGLPPNVCVPDPQKGGCQRPFHDPNDIGSGGPHRAAAGRKDIDGGRWTASSRSARPPGPTAPTRPSRRCAAVQRIDVMGYHDGGDIPNYWAYARNFVLQDHMFESIQSWSLPMHLFMVSGWSARCSRAGDPYDHVAPPTLTPTATASASPAW